MSKSVKIWMLITELTFRKKEAKRSIDGERPKKIGG